jgi:hypothetical protein
MANEARLNLVISARDEAKAVIEESVNNLVSMFSGLSERLSQAFNMEPIVQSFRGVTEAALGH